MGGTSAIERVERRAGKGGLAIYAYVDFSSREKKPRCARIGSAIRNEDGSIELFFDVNPTNIRRILIHSDD